MIKIFLTELKNLFTDAGVIIFFIVVPFLYPVLYSWLYNNEVANKVPAIVVDKSHSSLSREFTKSINATPGVKIVGYANSIEEAKIAIMEQSAKGIIYIPQTFSHDINKGIQTHVNIYIDMSSMLYYKSLLTSLTNVSLEMGSQIQTRYLNAQTLQEEKIGTAPLQYEAVPIFNPSGGYGSFLLPAVLMLIIQQTLLLGIGLSAGTARETNIYKSLIQPEDMHLGPLSIVSGKALCYFLVYLITSSYISMAIPRMFGFIQLASMKLILTILVPYMLACIFFGMTLSCLVRYRENVMLIVVFTSVPLLFLSGVSWPGSALHGGWKSVSYLFPSTFGINAYVKANSMGANFNDILYELRWLWYHTIGYFLLTCIVYRIQIVKIRIKNNKQFWLDKRDHILSKYKKH